MTYPHHRGALHFLTKAKKAIDSERETPKMASKKKKARRSGGDGRALRGKRTSSFVRMRGR